MRRVFALSAGWILALVCSIALSGCGDDEHRNMDHGRRSESAR